jgi:hypothetical protein
VLEQVDELLRPADPAAHPVTGDSYRRAVELVTGAQLDASDALGLAIEQELAATRASLHRHAHQGGVRGRRPGTVNTETPRLGEPGRGVGGRTISGPAGPGRPPRPPSHRARRAPSP